MKKLTWILVAVLVAAGLLAVRAKRVAEKNGAPLVRRVVPVVETVAVERGRVVVTRHVTGTVVADEEAQLAPRIMARLLEVRVREGDPVRSGQVLAVLDARELEDAVAQAGAGLAAAREAVAAAEAAWQAQREATARDRVLHEARAISDEQWEHSTAAERAARARLEAARAELKVAEKRHDQARTRHGYARLSAPFDGVVTARLADPGDLAVPGKPVLTVARRGGIRVRADLPVEDLARLAVGAPVTVTAPGVTLEAAVSRIVPATGASGLAPFEADLGDAPAALLPGATVGVDVALERAEGLVVPSDALLEGEGGSWVLRVDRSAGGERDRSEGTVHPVPVRVEARSAGRAVVEGDLSEGALVAVGEPSRLMVLAPGNTVRIVPREGEGGGT